MARSAKLKNWISIQAVMFSGLTYVVYANYGWIWALLPGVLVVAQLSRLYYFKTLEKYII